MNASARDRQPVALEETIAYPRPLESASDSDLGPEGTVPMPGKREETPGQHRYTYTSGARPLDGYTIKRAIGRGGFGEVYYATSDAGKEVALKLITRNLEVERRGVVQCMNLKSPHLVAIHDLKQNDDGDTFVIMEYVAGPSLAQILADAPTGLPPNEVRSWLKGLVDGVAYLHDHGIVHRDLKPANLFLEEGVVKIGDYGLSKAITAASQQPGHSECVGTCHYMAPETSTGKYHKPIDVYAIGVILYEMVTGRVPFDGESVGEVLMKHLTSRPDLNVLPEPFKAIVGRALAKDPNHRPQRVTDLLLPGDARKEPEVRFIGEKASAAIPSGMTILDEKPEEVHRIEPEDPVFYIGPDTRPTHSRKPANRSFNPWRWAKPPVRVASFRRPAPRPVQAPPQAVAPSPPRPATVPPARPAPPPVAAARTTPAPVAIEPPPPLPSGRIRVAELAGSMITAFFVASVTSALTLPLAALSQDAPVTDPRQMALLAAMATLGAWGLLAAGKFWEAVPEVGRIRKRLVLLTLGAVVGVAGYSLAEATHLVRFAPVSERIFEPASFSFAAPPIRQALSMASEYALYFGLVFLMIPWKSFTARGRKRRILFFPLVATGAFAAAVGSGISSIQPVAGLAVVIAGWAAQFASPWSRELAQYNRAMKRKAA